jgi:hypothetical protein
LCLSSLPHDSFKTHFIMGMSGIWDDSAIEDLVRWRDARNAG